MTETQERSDAQQAGRIRDARGEPVTQLDPVMMHLLHQHREIPAEPLQNLADEIGMGLTWAARLCFWSSILGLVCLLIAIAISTVRLNSGTIGWDIFARNLLPYCGIWVAPFAFWINTRNARFKRITKVMLEHRRCPHCGYDLQGFHVDNADGATVCPECGCAWLLNEPESTEEAHSQAD